MSVQDSSVKKIKVKQIKSSAGRIKSQIQTLKGLNLNKINKVVEVLDTPSSRGMIKSVSHLVRIID